MPRLAGLASLGGGGDVAVWGGVFLVNVLASSLDPLGVTVVSFCGATGLTARAAPTGRGVAFDANFCFSSGLKA